MQIPKDLRLFLGFRDSPALATAQSVDVDRPEAIGDHETRKNALEWGEVWQVGWPAPIGKLRRNLGSIQSGFVDEWWESVH